MGNGNLGGLWGLWFAHSAQFFRIRLIVGGAQEFNIVKLGSKELYFLCVLLDRLSAGKFGGSKPGFHGRGDHAHFFPSSPSSSHLHASSMFYVLALFLNWAFYEKVCKTVSSVREKWKRNDKILAAAKEAD